MVTINRDLNSQARSVEALFGVDADTVAQVKAEYLYSAYGEVMMKSGDLADKNNIGYSTRYREGKVSYAYRHYSPRLKKWLSKDPIAEQGGVNLYGMVGNMPTIRSDFLGLTWKKSKREGGKIEYLGKWPYDDKKTLSNIIHLNASEYSKWSSNEEIDEEECTISVKVPNTIVAIWAGDMDSFGRFYVNWNGQVSRLEEEYYVVEIYGNYHNPLGLIEDLRKNKELYGIFFWGHGIYNGKEYVGLGMWDRKDNMYYRQLYPKGDKPYQLGFLDLHACGSKAGEYLASPTATKNLFEGMMIPLPGGFGIELW